MAGRGHRKTAWRFSAVAEILKPLGFRKFFVRRGKILFDISLPQLEALSMNDGDSHRS
jgi:hypothetical protein